MVFRLRGLGTPRPHTAKPLRPKRRHGDHCHAVVARVGDAPLSNHDRQKRRRGILGGRIGEHFPRQRLEGSRSFVCLRIAQLDLDGTPAPVVLDDQVDLKALLVAEIMDAVVDAAVGGWEHAHVAQDEVLKEHPQRLYVAKQPLRSSPQQRRRKRRVAEVTLGTHANAGLRAYVLACCLLRKLVRKPKVCRSTAL